MKKIILLLALGFLCQPLYPQRTEYPQIGAQVFIEPGQTDKQIDGFFRILAQHGFETARIRMFGAHMLRPDGSWDFTLYDKAFDAAGKHGVKLFATLFPPTDELGDVGGFKFPRSKAHLLEIAGYIEAVVSHFRGHPALDTWVLQNEPGTGGTGPGRNDLTDEVFARWKAAQKTPAYDNGYLKADFTQERFHTDFTTWYLGWIASQVDLHDPAHHKHINPHQLLDNLADYDFPAYEGFLTSLGVSMHLSWHFGYFTRAQYPLGISLMADIIRSGAGKNPFWITEMQGGNVTASGREVLCPTAREITQWLWTGIAAGAEGVIFWTLNQRASALEAGEWGMLDFQGRPSDRLTAASEVARTAKAHKSFFREARPVRSGITLLYNTESLRTQQKNAAVSDDGRYEGRKASATMKSLAGAYEAIAAWGVVPEVCEMDAYDWSDPQGKTIVLTNLVALPSGAWERLDDFVRKGGRMIATGLTGFYDQNMHCILMDDFPLRRCFGAQISEYKAVAPFYDRMRHPCHDPARTSVERDPHPRQGAGDRHARRRCGRHPPPLRQGRGRVASLAHRAGRLARRQQRGRGFLRHLLPRADRPCPAALLTPGGRGADAPDGVSVATAGRTGQQTPARRRNRAFAGAARLGAPVMRRSVARRRLRQARSRRVCGFPVGQTGGMMQKTGIFVVAP